MQANGLRRTDSVPQTVRTVKMHVYVYAHVFLLNMHLYNHNRIRV